MESQNRKFIQFMIKLHFIVTYLEVESLIFRGEHMQIDDLSIQ